MIREQEEFELAAVDFRCPDCLAFDNATRHLDGGLRKCRVCREWWRPGVWENERPFPRDAEA